MESGPKFSKQEASETEQIELSPEVALLDDKISELENSASSKEKWSSALFAMGGSLGGLEIATFAAERLGWLEPDPERMTIAMAVLTLSSLTSFASGSYLKGKKDQILDRIDRLKSAR